MDSTLLVTVLGFGMIGGLSYAWWKAKKDNPDTPIGDIILMHVRNDVSTYMLACVAVASIAEGMTAATVRAAGVETNDAARMLSHISLIIFAFVGAITVSNNINNAIQSDDKGARFGWGVLSLISLTLTLYCPFANVEGLANGMGQTVHFELYIESLKFWKSTSAYQSEVLFRGFDYRTYSPVASMSQMMVIAKGILFAHYLVLLYEMIYTVFLNKEDEVDDKKEDKGKDKDKEKEKDKDKDKDEKQDDSTMYKLAKALGYNDTQSSKIAEDAVGVLTLAAAEEDGKELSLMNTGVKLLTEWDKADANEKLKKEGLIRSYFTRGVDKGGLGLRLPAKT